MMGDTPTASTKVSVKKWMGTDPYCDYCGCDLTKERFFVDGKTARGPWALMCPRDWSLNGTGRLGTGLGQKYDGKTLEKIQG